MFNSTPGTPRTHTPRTMLLSLRVIWAGLLMGQLAFLCATAFIIAAGRGPAAQFPAGAVRILIVINVLMLVSVIPIAYVIRALLLARMRFNGTFTLQKFAVAELILWAACEGVSFVGLVTIFLRQVYWPSLLIVLIAMGMQIVTFPRRGQIGPGGEPFGI